MSLLIVLAAAAFLPPDTKPIIAPIAQPVTLEILEARLVDTQQIIRDQNRTLQKLTFLAEDLFERIERLEANERDRQRPVGLRWNPSDLNRKIRTSDLPRTEFRIEVAPRGDLLSSPAVKRWHPPRQNCDEDDFTPGYWE